MPNPAQKRAVARYRHRLRKRGISRFEVIGLKKDKPLIRAIAKRLAVDDLDAARLRAEVGRDVGLVAPRRGGILAALRRSPLVGAELDISRPRAGGREIKL